MIGIIITREQIEAWAGRSLTDDELDRLDECIPHSSIPDAIDTIVSSFEAHECEYIGGRSELHTLCVECGSCGQD